jgi:uncharacterized SAM-binding protein YcdF (DUF218 family)
VYFFFTNAYILNTVLGMWELPATPLKDLHRRYPCAVVLGGFTMMDRTPNDRTYLNTAADRLMHSILLYKKGKVDYLLITGGNGALIKYTETEAGNAARVAELCGLPPSALWLEKQARTTRENATYSKQILDSVGIKDTVLLVTSAFHARRAAGTFAKVGIPFRLFTADFRAQKTRLGVDVLLIPSSDALVKWDMLIHECAGVAMYTLAGYM